MYNFILPSLFRVLIIFLSVATQAQVIDEPFQISDALVISSEIENFQISPDGSYVVYRADQNIDGVFELFSVPITGGNSVRLNSNLVNGGNVRGGNPNFDFQISSNSSHVVYRADQNADGIDELFSIPIKGGTPVQLTSNPNSFKISPDGTHVVYTVSSSNVFQLLSIPISGGSSIRLSSISSGFISDFKFTSDSLYIVYRAGSVLDVFELFRVPTTGGNIVPLNQSSSTLTLDVISQSFQINSDDTLVVFTAVNTSITNTTPIPIDLYSVPINGGSPIPLFNSITNDAAVIQGSVELSPDGSLAVFAVKQNNDNLSDFFSVPISGGDVIPLNNNLILGSTTSSNISQITPDGSTVLYAADQNSDGVFELFNTPINGGKTITLNEENSVSNFIVSSSSSNIVYVARPISNSISNIFSANIDGSNTFKLNDEILNGTGVSNNDNDFQISPNGSTIFYIADQLTTNLNELFFTPIDSGTSTRVNDDLPFERFETPSSAINSYQFSSDGQFLVYNAFQNEDNLSGLFSVRITTINSNAEFCFPIKDTNDNFITICL